MADTLVKSLGSLVQERKVLQRKEQQLAQRQQQLIRDLDQLLHGIGYQLKPLACFIHGELRSNGEDRSGVQCRAWTA